MSFAVVQNGNVIQILQLDVQFTIGEKTYSSAFLRNSTPQEKLEAGVWEIIDGTRADDRFYWVSNAQYRVNEVSNIVEASYPATAKALEDVTETPEGQTEPVTTKGLKSQYIAQTKQAAGSALAQTDWTVIRKMERNVDIPADVVTERAQIVADCNAKEAAISAATTIDELIAALS
jgi:predicted choloylglycine hydrolase